MRIINALLSTSVLLIFLFPQALAAPPGAHLDVTQVFVDDPNNPTSIMIIGVDLDFGSGPLSVTLGEFGALTITGAPSDTLIEADLPVGIFPGDFLLTVSMGNGQSQNDEYDLTIGAVGPQGPKGDKGDTGNTGPPGADGADGLPGADGADGADGLPGADGADGADGAPGADGASGGSVNEICSLYQLTGFPAPLSLISESPEVTCDDGIDNDCDAFIDTSDSDCGGVCGDGAVGSGEECDDGNTESGDGCSSVCRLEFCGDSIVQASLGEECDDGNSNAGDGCSPACSIEFCGDGVINFDLGEECDDGNINAGDGCSSACSIEFCGDGIVQASLGEECDDGNSNVGDGCDASCSVEVCIDNDGDGSCVDFDCNDDDPSIFPGALEFCDGLDNDCDELVDENLTRSGPNATIMCVNGAQSLICNAGFSDCNGLIADGCETNPLTNVNHCGICFNMCPLDDQDVAICVSGVCGFQ